MGCCNSSPALVSSASSSKRRGRSSSGSGRGSRAESDILGEGAPSSTGLRLGTPGEGDVDLPNAGKGLVRHNSHFKLGENHLDSKVPLSLAPDVRTGLMRVPSTRNFKDKYKFFSDPGKAGDNTPVFLGKGKFGNVQLAVEQATGESYAVKVVMKAGMTAFEREDLETEVAMLRQLRHPNIVYLKDFFEDDEHYFVVTEFVKGGQLWERILDVERHTEKDAREIIRTVMSAVKYCHERNVVHRDLKPMNILYDGVDEDAQIKIIDFGFAKTIQQTRARTRGSSATSNDGAGGEEGEGGEGGGVGDDDDDKEALLGFPDPSHHSGLHTDCGTQGYTAPELIPINKDAPRDYGKAVDVWAIGVMTYILLAGYPPFLTETDNEVELLHLIRTAKYEFHAEDWDSVSGEAKDFIQKMFIIDPTKRATVHELIAHPWMDLDLGVVRKPKDTEQQKLIASMNARRRLKKSIQCVIAANRFRTWSSHAGDRTGVGEGVGEGTGVGEGGRLRSKSADMEGNAAEGGVDEIGGGDGGSNGGNGGGVRGGDGSGEECGGSGGGSGSGGVDVSAIDLKTLSMGAPPPLAGVTFTSALSASPAEASPGGRKIATGAMPGLARSSSEQTSGSPKGGINGEVGGRAGGGAAARGTRVRACSDNDSEAQARILSASVGIAKRTLAGNAARRHWRKTVRSVVFMNRLMKVMRTELDDKGTPKGGSANKQGFGRGGGGQGEEAGSGVGEAEGKGSDEGGTGEEAVSRRKTWQAGRKKEQLEMKEAVNRTEDHMRRATARRRFKRAIHTVRAVGRFRSYSGNSDDLDGAIDGNVINSNVNGDANGDANGDGNGGGGNGDVLGGEDGEGGV